MNTSRDDELPVVYVDLDKHYISWDEARYVARDERDQVARFFSDKPELESSGSWRLHGKKGLPVPNSVSDLLADKTARDSLCLVEHTPGMQNPEVGYPNEGERTVEVDVYIRSGDDDLETMLVSFGDGDGDIPEGYRFIIKQPAGTTMLCTERPVLGEDRRWHGSVMTAAPKMYDTWFENIPYENSLRKLVPKGSERKAPLRYNMGKPKLSLLMEMPYALQGTTRILEFGMVKYDRGNYRQPPGFNYTEVVDCLMRHLLEFMEGKDLDKDSGRPLVDHIVCNALFLSETYHRYPNADDRVFRSTNEALVDPERRKTDSDGGDE